MDQRPLMIIFCLIRICEMQDVFKCYEPYDSAGGLQQYI